MTARKPNYENTPLPMPDIEAVSEEYRQDVKDLFDTWHSVRERNKALTDLYRMHNKFVDLGAVKLPSQLKLANTIVGWPKKAVDVMAVRSKFDGYVFEGSENKELQALCRRNKLRLKYKMGCKSALTLGESAFTVMAGENKGEVITRVVSANQHAVLWSKDTESIKCGIVVTSVDERGIADQYVLHEAEHVITINRTGEVKKRNGHHDRWTWESTPEENPIGRPLMVVMPYDADCDRPLGHSRITPEVIGITEKAMRDVLNMDIAAAFWTFPQRYLLGIDKKLFADDVPGGTVTDEDGDVIQLKTKLETYMNLLIGITPNENGDIPHAGQFQPLDVENLIKAFENDAQRFSGATNVPLGQLGVLSNTYTSSDALGAANDPLILAVEDMNADNADVMAELARLMLCVSRGCTEDKLTENELGLEAYFKDPSQPTIAARADGWTKIAGADQAIVGTDVWYEGLGLNHQTIGRLKKEKGQISTIDALNKIAESIVGQSEPIEVNGEEQEMLLPAEMLEGEE